MFEIAGTIGIARKMGYDFAFPEWKNYDHLERFKSHEDIDVQKYFVNPLPVTNQPLQEFRVPWGYHDVSPPDNRSLSGHMQSEKYFLHCESEVFHYFQLKELSDRRFEPGTVAIHLRAGDYGGDYHPIMGRDYYHAAMQYFEGPFVVFSDDPEKAKQIIGIDAEYIEGNHYMVDFYLMSKCDHFIISNSTFSWWAAWLGRCQDKRVVAPAKWFGPAARISSKDIYCRPWIVL